MKASTPRGRLRQVELWLMANHPVPGGYVRVRVERVAPDPGEPPHVADTTRTPTGFQIRLDRAAVQRWGEEMVETLLHEWAHVLAWRQHRENDEFACDHDEEWGLAYARVYRAYYDEGGQRDSEEFSSRPWR